MTIDYKMLGKRLKDSRLSAKKTQEQIAEHLDVSVSYISQVERGVTKISLDTLAKYTAFINGDISAIISGVSIKDKAYMFDELNINILELYPKERQMVNDFVMLLMKNR